MSKASEQLHIYIPIPTLPPRSTASTPRCRKVAVSAEEENGGKVGIREENK